MSEESKIAFNVAFAKAQYEMKVADKSKFNKAWKSNHSDYNDLVAASRDALYANGFSLLQYLDSEGDCCYFVSKLKHAAGYEEVSRMRIYISDPSNHQELVKASTYQQRNIYRLMTGVPSTEIDDDGNSSAGIEHDRAEFLPNNESKSPYASEKQVGLIRKLLGNNKEFEEVVFKRCGCSSLDKIPRDKADPIIKWLMDNNHPEVLSN